uniref:Transmembrane protein n=1 Tax=Cucumis sativus TaxID=3659 RepID=A0A0A0LVQ2_CUCSA
MEQHLSESSLNLNNYDVIFRSTSSSKNCSSKVEWLKRMVKLTVFCLLLGLFFSLFSLFPHSFSVYFSTFLFSILTHAVERKYMFLICNIGILFLLATSSVSSSSSSSSFGNYCPFPHSRHNHHHNLFEHDVVAAVATDEESDSDHTQEEEEEKEEGICRGELLEEELEEDEGCFTDEVEEEEEEEKEGKKRRKKERIRDSGEHRRIEQEN